MGLFDLFKKKQKPYICAQCKKEITDEESKWIGNHRFCSDCAVPQKACSISKHHDETKNTFICQKCCKELEIKYMHKNKICVKCALKTDTQDYQKNSTTQNNRDIIFSQDHPPKCSYSDIAYVGAIIPIHLDWCDIEGAPQFSFAGAPHFDEISIGLIQRGKYINQLFITIINDGYPSGNGCGTTELLPKMYHSYEGINRYVEERGFSIYQPITEDEYNENIKELMI